MSVSVKKGLYRSAEIEANSALRERRKTGGQSPATMNAVKSVERALAILKTFDETAPFLTAQDIATRIGIPRPSVYRFLRTLCDHRFLVEVGDSEARRFAVGSSLLGLSKVAFGQAELRRVAQPVMQLVADKSNETTYLSVRHGANAVCIENFDAQAPLRYGGRVGNTYPLYAGCPKVILAFLDDELRDHLIKGMTSRSDHEGYDYESRRALSPTCRDPTPRLRDIEWRDVSGNLRDRCPGV